MFGSVEIYYCSPCFKNLSFISILVVDCSANPWIKMVMKFPLYCLLFFLFFIELASCLTVGKTFIWLSKFWD